MEWNRWKMWKGKSSSIGQWNRFWESSTINKNTNDFWKTASTKKSFFKALRKIKLFGLLGIFGKSEQVTLKTWLSLVKVTLGLDGKHIWRKWWREAHLPVTEPWRKSNVGKCEGIKLTYPWPWALTESTCWRMWWRKFPSLPSRDRGPEVHDEFPRQRFRT